MVIKELLANHCGAKQSDMHEASCGIEAIRKYKLLQPDLVLLDIFMPCMGGKEVVIELLKFDAGAKIIMCTSAAEKKDVLDCIQAGALDYITKPPVRKRFLAAVLKALGNVLSVDPKEAAEKEASKQAGMPVGEKPETLAKPPGV